MVALLELPDELICQILSKLGANKDTKGRLSPLANGHHDIVGFALTCQRAWALSEQCLYSTMLVRNATEVASLGEYYWTDGSSPLFINSARVRHLRDFAAVLTEDDDHCNDGFLKLSEVISSMPAGQLTRLHVELPYWQFHASQFWFRLASTFGNSTHGPLSRFFTLPWASRLQHCHLNLQQDRGGTTTIDGLISVFTAPQLKSLVLVGVEFSSDISSWSHFNTDGFVMRGSPVERLSVHQCCIPPKAFEVLLSMPRSLKYLSYFGSGFRRRSVFGLCEHLVQQNGHLTQLDLDLADLSYLKDYETHNFGFRLGNLTSVTDLTIKKEFSRDPEDVRMLLGRLPWSLRRLNICHFRYGTHPEAMVVAAQYYLTKDLSTDMRFQDPAVYSALDARCRQKSKLLPDLEELSVSFSLRKSSDTIDGSLRRCFEYIGDRYRNELGWRFVVNRIAEPRVAIPPYLWDDYVAEFVKVYDNMAKDNLWESKTDYEIVEDEERKRTCERGKQESAVQEERARFEADEARGPVLRDSMIPPSPPPSVSPVQRPLSESVVTASPANMAVVAGTMAMANANMSTVLGRFDR